MERAEEELLVLAAQDGSEAAFRLLHRHYQAALLRFAYRLCGDPEVASDAVQEAWLTLARRLRRLRDPRAFRVWLYRTTRWSVLDAMRAQRHRNGSEVLVGELPEQHAHAEPPEEPSDLRTAINRLPAAERQMITLFYLDEFSVREIAAVLAIPPGTVKSRLNRARRLLKERFYDAH